MKFRLLFILIFYTSRYFCQDNINNIIEYSYIHDLKTSVEEDSDFLYFDQDKSIYFQYGKANEKIKFEDINNSNFKAELLTYFFINNNSKDYFFLGYKVPPKKILTTDTIPEIKWTINPTKKKKILGYDCLFATAIFRGRSWNAWFTKEIPVSYGPWKLHGLPGLILEAEDSSTAYSFIVKKITLNTQAILNKIFLDYIEEKKKNLISFEEYIKKENIQKRDWFNKILAELPLGTEMQNPILRENDLEVQFEWEKSPEIF
ncbi:GLPGLI family protein [Chryseobacterium oryzae]|uniref:GLPGLI family protein n=1 Tax=Chryseobacterium oryzae TaxID=2929799 RepID=A0ABY4BJM7_9FLAO|nr:GLPGLI family protein [Chryseobacterium oryzae]UOE39379.1 GLPGLI family protein [Chryseobacterium oryzae]